MGLVRSPKLGLVRRWVSKKEVGTLVFRWV